MQTLWGNEGRIGQSLSGPLDSVALLFSGEEGLFWKKKKIFQGTQSAMSRMNSFVSPWLLIPAHHEPCLNWPPLLHECLERVSFLLGKERLPLFYRAQKLMEESLREALLSTSRMKGSLLFEQASGKNQL